MESKCWSCPESANAEGAQEGQLPAEEYCTYTLDGLNCVQTCEGKSLHDALDGVAEGGGMENAQWATWRWKLVVEALRGRTGDFDFPGARLDVSRTNQRACRFVSVLWGSGCRVRIGGLTIPHFPSVELAWPGPPSPGPSQSPVAFPSLLRTGGGPEGGAPLVGSNPGRGRETCPPGLFPMGRQGRARG